MPAVITFTHHERPWTLNKERSAHPMVHRKMTTKWREAFATLATAEVAAGNTMTTVVITVRQTCNRPPLPDPGSCVGAAKAAIDGLVDAGFLTGDRGDVVKRLIFEPARRTGVDSLTLWVRELTPSDRSPDEVETGA